MRRRRRQSGRRRPGLSFRRRASPADPAAVAGAAGQAKSFSIRVKATCMPDFKYFPSQGTRPPYCSSPTASPKTPAAANNTAVFAFDAGVVPMQQQHQQQMAGVDLWEAILKQQERTYQTDLVAKMCTHEAGTNNEVVRDGIQKLVIKSVHALLPREMRAARRTGP